MSVRLGSEEYDVVDAVGDWTSGTPEDLQRSPKSITAGGDRYRVDSGPF